ncbi:YdcH family protein [Vannielia litorea]|uniref:DUF465 domain-containing protein n=1 Tax=Vannielia litorea TaxID=1217970 RepID=A0A1N6ECH2_9RHOB|nr:YdcH family protein [Vannielia litorea]SIN80693.1 hypothetical protein SAMN05444002_0589 [Vannielia litorea]
MSQNTPHELAQEFPGREAEISALKQGDAHFARMVDRYHELNRAIHRAETNVEPTDDLHMVELRKERMYLKDQVAAALNVKA